MDLTIVVSFILLLIYIVVAVIGYWKKFLFNAPIDAKESLKAGIISDRLKDAFRDNAFPLSMTARLVGANGDKVEEEKTSEKGAEKEEKSAVESAEKPKEEQKNWLIEDGDNLYVLHDSGKNLEVYKPLGILEKYNFQMMGPFLMWNTEKGKNVIDRIAQKRKFWNAYGSIAIVIAVVSMIFNMVLMFFEDLMATNIPASAAPTPQMMIGLPGINPFIPIWYGILGLAVGIFIHEFGHGILSRVGKIAIKSLGIVICVVPIGAFVEPDEAQINASAKRVRARMFAAGPSTNVIFAFVCAMIFSWGFMGSIVPAHDGIIVTQIIKDSPAMQKELAPGMGIAGAYVVENGELTGAHFEVSDLYEYGKMLDATSGKSIALDVDDTFTVGENTTIIQRLYMLDSDTARPSRLGIVLSPDVSYVHSGSSAALAGITTNMALTSISDGTTTATPESPIGYYTFLSNHKPGDNVSVVMSEDGSAHTFRITLGDLSNYTGKASDSGIATPCFGTSVTISSIEDGSPAHGKKSAGIAPGMLIYHIAKVVNGSVDQTMARDLTGPVDFTDFMDTTNASDMLQVTTIKDGKDKYVAYVVLVDKGFVNDDASFSGKGYLGVASINANAFKTSLAQPIRAAEGNPFMMLYYSINYIMLPLERLSPFPAAITMNFAISGPLAILPPDVFWTAANAFYWLFWLNLMVGITNTLPAVPLDGGLLFRDWIDTLYSKFKWPKEKRELYVKWSARAMSLVVLFMILWLLIAPRLMALLA